MEVLNLPAYSFRYKEETGKKFIFDFVRQKFVALTPEEWVRQNFLCYLTEGLKYPASLTGVEKAVKVNGLTQRCDIVVYNRSGCPAMIVECKAPSVTIGKVTLEQAARYNVTLRVPYLVLTNGKQHYCIYTDADTGQSKALNGLPSFADLQGK